MRKLMIAAAAAAMAFSVSPAFAGPDRSSGRKDQDRGMREMPHCAKPLGTIAMVEPENQWWRQYSLGSPEAIIKVFVQESHCFTLVNRGRSMQSRAMERALADNGELQRGSNMGKGQVRAADFLLEPNIVTTNDNSGGSNVGGAIGGGGLPAFLGGTAAYADTATSALAADNNASLFIASAPCCGGQYSSHSRYPQASASGPVK